MKKITILLALAFFAFAASGQQLNTLNLMPVPKQIEPGLGEFRISSQFTVSIQAITTDTILYRAVNRAYQTLNRKTGLVFGQKYIGAADTMSTAPLKVISLAQSVPGTEVDEHYSLVVTENNIVLRAPNTIGILHGLQTLIQLLGKDDKGYYLSCVSIDDSPRFKWRGLMIDAARHFISVEEIKRNIDAMAAVKMNVLHWHLTDDEGFRVESKLFPLLQRNGSNGDYYTQEQLKEVVAYARDRGIIVVPEFDMPGHSQSWFAAYPELASQPGPYRPGSRMQWQNEHPNPNAPKSTSIADIIANMISPTFDPTNEKVYVFLDKFIGEMTRIFPSGYMHIGADENNGMAWKLNPAIMDWMKAHNMQTTDELQRYYVQRVYNILKKHSRRMIGWEEIFYDKLPKDAIVHKWIPDDNSMIKSYGKPEDFTAHGNLALVSAGFYTDVFMPAYIHYNNPSLAGANDPGILGGEAAQWTELADNENIDGRIWPRAGAIAERLWSPAAVNDVDDMYRRMFVLSSELDEQGLPHISNYERALRRLAGNMPIEQLEILTDVLTPVKGYRKLMSEMFKGPQASFQTTPLTSVSDIVFVDSETKRKFRALVKLYLEKHDKDAVNNIRAYLLAWQQNDSALEPLFAGNKRLVEVQEHSANLSAAAVIGLEALDRADKMLPVDADWVQKKSDELGTYEKSHNDTEIAVIPEIAALVTGHLAAEPASYPTF
ncbi:hexosaminidase [Mucilaginibacter frigoritolerans]|uniref:beta-N-acetylhexosaminidase n=1 Tax=Mucilaginibacter frigoritolerans TaxID=652788 RepID=A0A562TQJ6_9SPHI|nr:family 20 glycosylhydrolase [Mucilaginibacter frigoritolerans]TWI95847.1 hexosaminidase [Mucilaginibacter frigoritolerans]